MVTQVRFNPANETSLATGSEDGLVCVYDTTRASAEEALVSVINANCAVRRVGFFGPGGQGIYCLSGSETLSLWHAATAQCIVDHDDIRSRSEGWGGAAHSGSGPPGTGLNYLVDCFTADDATLYLLGGDWSGAVTLCEVTDAAVTPRWRSTEGHTGLVRACAAHQGLLCTGGEDARVCGWDWRGDPGAVAARIAASHAHRPEDSSAERRKAHRARPYAGQQGRSAPGRGGGGSTTVAARGRGKRGGRRN